MAGTKTGSVMLHVRALGGEPLPRLKASTMVVSGGRLARRKLPVRDEPPFVFKLEMEVGSHPVFVSAPGYYESVQQVKFSSSATVPDVAIILEPCHSARFKAVNKLAAHYRKVIVGSARARDVQPAAMFLRLADRKKAAALNILAKMHTVKFEDKTVLSHVSHIEKFHEDRVYVRLEKRSRLKTTLDDLIEHDHDARISEAPKGMHKGFDAGSFKTRESTGRGNLQLSFADPAPGEGVLVDSDIDTDVLRHLFGEVFVNHLTDTKTDPFKVYGILTEMNIQPEYELAQA